MKFGAKTLPFVGLSILMTFGGWAEAQGRTQAPRPVSAQKGMAPAVGRAGPSAAEPAEKTGMAPVARPAAAGLRGGSGQGGVSGDRAAHAGAPVPAMGAAGQAPAKDGMTPGGAKEQESEGEEAPEDQAPKKKRQAGCMGQYGTLIMLVAMFAIFYFMLIRPQQKKQKEHQAMLDQLKVGDRVLTQGGLLGKITGFRDPFVVLEIQEKVRIKVLRSAVSTKYTQDSGNK